MPDNPSDAIQSALAPATGALVVSGTDAAYDPEDLRPGREYDAEGLYVHGPLRARSCLARLIPPNIDAPPAPPPNVAHAQTRMKRDRARDGLKRRERFLAAVRGESAGRNRKAA